MYVSGDGSSWSADGRVDRGNFDERQAVPQVLCVCVERPYNESKLPPLLASYVFECVGVGELSVSVSDRERGAVCEHGPGGFVTFTWIVVVVVAAACGMKV